MKSRRTDIEKQAMDLRKSRYDVASLILKTYQM